jgi:putative hydrolase of the HAD superfamily
LLILFDLDDTLIDTSACLTPAKLEKALIKMVDEGLKLDDFKESFELLKTLDQTAENARSAIAAFIVLVGIDRKFYDIGVKEVYESDDFNLNINTVEGAISLLEELQTDHKIILVTAGKRDRQLKKLESAGIDSRLFSKIVVCEPDEKKIHYQEIITELNLPPSEVVVCGDKISADLTPAKELGAKTVHFKNGRGRFAKGREEDVDYVIEKLDEIREIIKEWSKK